MDRFLVAFLLDIFLFTFGTFLVVFLDDVAFLLVTFLATPFLVVFLLLFFFFFPLSLELFLLFEVDVPSLGERLMPDPETPIPP